MGLLHGVMELTFTGNHGDLIEHRKIINHS